MITISFLADHLDVIPTLSNWFRDQWPDFYANWSQADFEQDFLEDASRNRLPIRLLAFESSELVGTIVLREYGRSETSPEVQPELGGLYVIESHRGHGIATELVRAGMNLARNQGYESVFATTVVAAGILERLGWEFAKKVILQVQGGFSMATFMNSFSWNQALNDEFNALIPIEQENVRKLMAAGKLLHLFLAEDNSGGWAVHSGESLEEVASLIETMPLRKFMNINIKKLAD